MALSTVLTVSASCSERAARPICATVIWGVKGKSIGGAPQEAASASTRAWTRLSVSMSPPIPARTTSGESRSGKALTLSRCSWNSGWGRGVPAQDVPQLPGGGVAYVAQGDVVLVFQPDRGDVLEVQLEHPRDDSQLHRYY